MSNKGARADLRVLYGSRCMLTMVKKKLTYHHIQKKCDGGATNVKNGAILSEASQEWLHNNLEHNDKELYNLVNECLQLYKLCIEQNKTDLIEMYKKECVPEFQDRILIRRVK